MHMCDMQMQRAYESSPTQHGHAARVAVYNSACLRVTALPVQKTTELLLCSAVQAWSTLTGRSTAGLQCMAHMAVQRMHVTGAAANHTPMLARTLLQRYSMCPCSLLRVVGQNECCTSPNTIPQSSCLLLPACLHTHTHLPTAWQAKQNPCKELWP
jgi:hypothetical protein